MVTVTGHTTRAAGTVLTAAIYNTDHTTHVNNSTNLNTGKVEAATPPVVDGHLVVFSGTGGAAVNTAGIYPDQPRIDVKFTLSSDNDTSILATRGARFLSQVTGASASTFDISLDGGSTWTTLAGASTDLDALIIAKDTTVLVLSGTTITEYTPTGGGNIHFRITGTASGTVWRL